MPLSSNFLTNLCRHLSLGGDVVQDRHKAWDELFFAGVKSFNRFAPLYPPAAHIFLKKTKRDICRNCVRDVSRIVNDANTFRAVGFIAGHDETFPGAAVVRPIAEITQFSSTCVVAGTGAEREAQTRRSFLLPASSSRRSTRGGLDSRRAPAGSATSSPGICM